MHSAYDFVAACRPGTMLRTRDRSEATITGVAPAEGLVFGEVRLFGPCAWHRDGRYRDAPAGVAGPLDLMAPQGETATTPRKTMSLEKALDPANRSFCCD